MHDLLRYAKENLAHKTSYKLALAVVVFLFFEAWLHPAFSQVPVELNGKTLLTTGNETVGEALRGTGLRTTAGDLLDIDGRVFKRGRGWAPRILVNGRATLISEKIGKDDRIEVIPALDRTEPIVTEVLDVILADEIKGEGEYTVVRALGIVGKKLVARGRDSGKIVSVRNLVQAQPFKVARTSQKPAKIIALTFDDGPTPPYTGQVVRTLQDLHATGTFFVLGQQAALWPDSVRQVKAAGFQVENHSYSHARMNTADEETIVRELTVASNTIVPLTGQSMHWFRPPYGAVNEPLRVIAAGQGYHTLRWHIDSRDWEELSPEDIADKVIREARPGAVVLMHDGGGDRTNTVKALPLIIRALYEQGYSFVTLEQRGR